MFRGGIKYSLLTAASAVLLAACGAAQISSYSGGWYRQHSGVMPRDDGRIYVCHGFGCAYKTPVDFSFGQRAKLRKILAAGGRSPEAERRAIAKAVAWNEARVAPVVGSADDVGGYDLRNSGKQGQMDCIDEATNTTSLLLVAQRQGLLRHHDVVSPVARGFFIDGEYPHATAVVVEKQSGKAYAIDSWPRGNAKLPVVQDLDRWFAALPEA
ncbi:hypothetical protein HPQ64_14265 [Rhizobiales bacterium]|uniref:hypothetical protein n=1 Tax=Hongsoonwoonella zoysiae TaxID=2821844 RepID=UPI00156144E2|nr:hypothetical protein [Hongsoonwoonella zoysiae]NRG18853.1 hypothetical protein [Hongsoonwoonella zoysiae]